MPICGSLSRHHEKALIRLLHREIGFLALSTYSILFNQMLVSLTSNKSSITKITNGLCEGDWWVRNRIFKLIDPQSTLYPQKHNYSHSLRLILRWYVPGRTLRLAIRNLFSMWENTNYKKQGYLWNRWNEFTPNIKAEQLSWWVCWNIAIVSIILIIIIMIINFEYSFDVYVHHVY